MWFFAFLWTASYQALLPSTISWSLLKFISNESVMLSNDLIFCPPLFPLSLFSPSIRVFSKESTLHIRWPKYWGFSFSISPSNGLMNGSFMVKLIMCWCVLSNVQLCNSSDCSPAASSVLGISRQEYWNGLPFPPSEDLPNPGIEPSSPASPALQWMLYCWAIGETLNL